MGSSTPRHVTTMNNTICTTHTLMGLLLEPLFLECWNNNSYHQATPYVVVHLKAIGPMNVWHAFHKKSINFQFMTLEHISKSIKGYIVWFIQPKGKITTPSPKNLSLHFKGEITTDFLKWYRFSNKYLDKPQSGNFLIFTILIQFKPNFHPQMVKLIIKMNFLILN